MIDALIVNIGDELLIGQVVNTNAAYLGKGLLEAGVTPKETLVVGDERSAILRALDRGWKDFDVTIVSGGLGPTHDDVTKHVVAEYFGRSLEFHEEIFDSVVARFHSFGYTKVPESNRSQAMVPQGFRALRNERGTSPGLLHKTNEKLLAIVPGVPAELKYIWSDSLGPIIKEMYEGRGAEFYVSQTIHTVGIGESSLAEKIGDVDWIYERGASLAFLPNAGGVRLRVSAQMANRSEAEETVGSIVVRLREIAGGYAMQGEASLAEAVIARLKELKKKVATAESCTGGMIAERLTEVSGSSAVVVGGIVSYWNEVKHSLLGVRQETLDEFGAVSEQTATEMAEGALERLEVDFALSATGIAGPTGGSDEKPVGTVWIGLAERGRPTKAWKFRFLEGRDGNRERTVTKALQLLRERLG